MELTIMKDTQDLEQLEIVIQKNIGAFYEVGRALMEIRDRELHNSIRGKGYCPYNAKVSGRRFCLSAGVTG